MNNDIVIISSSAYFTEKYCELLKKRNLDYPIFEATGDKALEIAKNCVSQGTKVIITRGRNLRTLRKNINIVIIDVRYTYEDIYFSLEEAKQYSNKIAYFSFDLAYEVALKFKNISGENFLLIKPESVSHIDELVKKFIDEGIQVFIGGFTVEKAAKKYGAKNIMIKVDETSLEIALNDALSILNFQLERKKNYATIAQILNSTSEGIIGIDKYSEVTYINHRAKKFIRDENNKLEIDQILNLSKIKDTISSGISAYNEMISIGKNSLILSSRPIKIEDNILGAVISIQKADHVQSAEMEIRKKLNPKGLVAKRNFSDIIGKSRLLRSTINKAKKFASSNSTILLTGQSGTGKEIFAQSIHNYSNRRGEPFVAVNCAALPASILESELFGYTKGAFTGARPEGKMGIFELAHNGTVFLDEVGEMSQDIQAKLLRVIQEKEIMRIGDDKVIPVDVRIISATNKNLLESVEKNKFREDLYYRLCVLELELPTLEERKDDIPLLVKHFISRNAPEIKITDEACNLLQGLYYPGNIRQLNNIVERLIVMSCNNIIDEYLVRDVLNIKLDGLKENNFEDKPKDKMPKILKMEEQLIKEVLEKNKGNKTKAANELGMGYTTLWRKLKKM